MSPNEVDLPATFAREVRPKTAITSMRFDDEGWQRLVAPVPTFAGIVDAACLQRHAGMIVRGAREAVQEAEDRLRRGCVCAVAQTRPSPLRRLKDHPRAVCGLPSQSGDVWHADFAAFCGRHRRCAIG
jgi:hypothetical protein